MMEKKVMIKKYKIKEILHSGKKGERGLPVLNKKYEYVLGFDCFFDKDNITVGSPFIFYFISNPEYAWWGMSTVVSVNEKPDEKKLIVETLNSIYIFEELGDFIASEEAQAEIDAMMKKVKLLATAGGVR